MDEAAKAATGGQEGPRKRGRFGLWLLLSLVLLAGLGVLGVLGLTGRPLPAPDWLVARIEARVNAAIAGQGRMTLEAAELVVDEEFVPRVRLRGLRAFTVAGAPLADLPELRITFKAQPMLRGKLEPRRIRVGEASITLTRDATGALGLSLAGGEAAFEGVAAGSPAEILDAIDRAFAAPLLAGIERIEADRVAITLDDARSGKVWRVSDGRMTLVQTPRDVSISLGFSLAGIGDSPAEAELSFTTLKTSPAARFGASVAGVSASDLAAQSTALAWLSVLDAPISGSFRGGIDEAGQVGRLDATLEIGAGALHPTEAAKPVAFDRAKVYFSFSPAAGRLDFTEIAVDSRALRVRADGRAWLRDFAEGVPEALVAQVRITGLQADPEGLFQTPVRFSQGALDLKLTLAPFAVTIGQLALVEGGRRIGARGEISAGDLGWTTALDVNVDAITHDRLLALWPPGLVPKTREWIAANVTTGELFGVSAAIRLAPEAEPRLSLGYEFRGAEVRILRTLPPVREGKGYAKIADNSYVLVVDKGHLTAPLGGKVDVAGSVLKVDDIRVKPAQAQITLRTDSTITGALSLLNEPPFGFLSKAGRPVDIAEGRAVSEALLSMPLVEKVAPQDIDYAVTARLLDVTSDRIVVGRQMQAGALDMRATREGLQISGPGTVSGVPFRVTWTQGFGPEAQGRSRVEGSVELSPRFLDAFGIGLPDGAVTGEGQGQIEIDLERDAPARFRLTSDLNQLRLSLPQIGWSKPVGRAGQLEVAGELGTPPKIETLSLQAPGLAVTGNVSLRPDGALDVARFSRVDTGWFRGSVELAGRGAGRPVGVSVTGGSADMRRASFAGAGGGGGNTPLRVSLDRLQITEGIALTGFRGNFTAGRGMSGDFQARVNGEAPVSGTVIPAEGGRSAYRLTSDDAGAMMRAAGIFSRGRGGTLSLALNPVAAAGSYDGQASIRSIRVRDAPVLAELLGAISVIGLLEQLGGEGILFTEVEGRFRLSPNALELRSGRAVGASLGVTMAGVYEFAASRLDMQGVVSPIYLLNAIGQVVSRPGEGLFGFNYRIRGTADKPVVNVNPLSILTPGRFRDIFRRPVPTVSE